MNPIVLADNRFLDGTPAATGTAAGSDVLNIRDLRTYTYWQAAASGTNYLTVDCATAKSADCLGILTHNLFTAAAAVSVESSPDNSAWTQRLAPFTPADDRAKLKTFTTASARYWRIKIVTAAVAPRLAIAILGSRIDFPFSPDKGFVPFSESVEAEGADSKSGNQLGVVVRYFPVDIKPVFSYVDRSFVDNTWRPFRESYGRLRKPFFWGWDLTAYPEQVFFVTDAGRYDPPVSRLAYYDRLSLDLKGMAERGA